MRRSASSRNYMLGEITIVTSHFILQHNLHIKTKLYKHTQAVKDYANNEIQDVLNAAFSFSLHFPTSLQ